VRQDTIAVWSSISSAKRDRAIVWSGPARDMDVARSTPFLRVPDLARGRELQARGDHLVAPELKSSALGPR
jgi:hypothetical protein